MCVCCFRYFAHISAQTLYTLHSYKLHIYYTHNNARQHSQLVTVVRALA